MRLTQKQAVERYSSLLDEAPVYQKTVMVQAYVPEIASMVATILDTGRLEATKVAYPSDYVVINPGGEQYVVDKEEFEDNYDHEVGFDYRAKGKVSAIQYTGPTVKFEADWGWGTLQTNDWLVCRPGKSDAIWHVGFKEFSETYEKTHVNEKNHKNKKKRKKGRRDKKSLKAN